MNEPQQTKETESGRLTDAPCSAFMDSEPITEEWLEGQGYVRVESGRGPKYCDHFQKGDVNLWEFNGTGNWLWNTCDSVNMRTRGKIRLLEEWVRGDMPNEPSSATAAGGQTP